jgi:hypothetical protein
MKLPRCKFSHLAVALLVGVGTVLFTAPAQAAGDLRT